MAIRDRDGGRDKDRDGKKVVNQYCHCHITGMNVYFTIAN